MSFQGLHPKGSEFRINMMNSKLVRNYAKYKQFQITNAATNYMLLVDGFTGTSNDALKSQNQQMFSAYDVDNDKHTTHSCAYYHFGA